jgi:TonB family protein
MIFYIVASIVLHVLFVLGMVWGGIRFAPARRPLPSATIVHLVRPAPRAALPGLQAMAAAERLQAKVPVPPVPEKKRLVTPTKKKPAAKQEAPKEPPKVEAPKAEAPEKGAGEGQALSGAAGTMRVEGGFGYDWYLALIQSKIEQNFRPPPGRRRPLMTIMEFRISKGGQIVGLRRKQSSGDFLFDQAAERAIQATGRFPPLPANFEASELGINFEFVSNPSR